MENRGDCRTLNIIYIYSGRTPAFSIDSYLSICLKKKIPYFVFSSVWAKLSELGRVLKAFKFATICTFSSGWLLFIVLLGLYKSVVVSPITFFKWPILKIYPINVYLCNLIRLYVVYKLTYNHSIILVKRF